MIMCVTRTIAAFPGDLRMFPEDERFDLEFPEESLTVGLEKEEKKKKEKEKEKIEGN